VRPLSLCIVPFFFFPRGEGLFLPPGNPPDVFFHFFFFGPPFPLSCFTGHFPLTSADEETPLLPFFSAFSFFGEGCSRFFFLEANSHREPPGSPLFFLSDNGSLLPFFFSLWRKFKSPLFFFSFASPFFFPPRLEYRSFHPPPSPEKLSHPSPFSYSPPPSKGTVPFFFPGDDFLFSPFSFTG